MYHVVRPIRRLAWGWVLERAGCLRGWGFSVRTGCVGGLDCVSCVSDCLCVCSFVSLVVSAFIPLVVLCVFHLLRFVCFRFLRFVWSLVCSLVVLVVHGCVECVCSASNKIIVVHGPRSTWVHCITKHIRDRNLDGAHFRQPPNVYSKLLSHITRRTAQHTSARSPIGANTTARTHRSRTSVR